MKKTKNLLFTLLVMGLIATPVLKVNADEVEEPLNGTPVAQTDTISPEGDGNSDLGDAGAADGNDALSVGQSTGSSSGEVAPAGVYRVEVTDENGNYVISSMGGTTYSSVSNNVSKVVISALDSDDNVVRDVITKELVVGDNKFVVNFDDVDYTFNISRNSAEQDFTNLVHSAIYSKYKDKYFAYYDENENTIVIAYSEVKDENVQEEDQEWFYYSYDFSLEEYETVDAVVEAFENAIQGKADEAEVPTEDGVLTNENMNIAKKNAEVIKAYSYNSRWTIDASKVTSKTSDIDIRVALNDEIKLQTREKIEKLLNDKDKRILIDFYHTGKLPKGTKIGIYANDTFDEDETLTLYYYNPKTNKLEVIAKNLKVDDEGVVEFMLDHCSSYVLLPSKNSAKRVQLLATRYNPQTGTMNVVLYAGIALASLAGIVVLRKQMN